MSYSGDCEDVFDPKSNSKSLVTEDLTKRALQPRESSDSRVPREQSFPTKGQVKASNTVPTKVLNEKILDYLDFSFVVTRTKFIIIQAFERSALISQEGIIYIGELIRMNRQQLSEKLSLGQESVGAIEKALANKGLYLDTKIPEEWMRPQVDISIEILNERVVDYLGFNLSAVQGFTIRYMLRLEEGMRDRIMEFLRTHLIIYIGDLIQKTEKELLSKVDSEVVDIIKKLLMRRGLNLATKLPRKWTPPVMHTTEVLNKEIVDYLDFSFVDLYIKNAIIQMLSVNRIVYIGELIQRFREDLIYINSDPVWQNGFLTDPKLAYRLSRRYIFNDKRVSILEQALAQRGLYLGTRISKRWIPPDAERIPLKILDEKIIGYLDFDSSLASFVKNSADRDRLDIGNMVPDRVFESIKGSQLVYIGELIQRTREDLLEVYGIIPSHILVIEEALAQRGLHLSTKFSRRWVPPAVEG